MCKYLTLPDSNQLFQLNQHIVPHVNALPGLEDATVDESSTETATEPEGKASEQVEYSANKLDELDVLIDSQGGSVSGWCLRLLVDTRICPSPRSIVIVF